MKRRVALLCVSGCLVSAGIVLAQGKKTSEPDKYPGTMTFRCQSYVAACPSSEAPDRALGDGSDYALLADGSAGVGLYKQMREGVGVPSGEMHFNPGPETNNFVVTLDFGLPAGDICMNPYVRCFPYVGQVIELKTQMALSTDVVDVNGEPVATGLFSIREGHSGKTRLWFNFQDPNPTRDTGWRVRFSSTEFQGSTDITVARTGICTWEFEAGPDDRAGVWGYEAPPGKKRPERVDYGLFVIPFKLTFTAFDAPIPGTTQRCPR